MIINLMLAALKASLVFGLVASQCPETDEDKRFQCARLVYSRVDCSGHNFTHPVLSVPSETNQTLLNEEVELTVNLTNYNVDDEPYTEIICMKKVGFFTAPHPYFLDCHVANNSFSVIPVKWKTAGNDLSVYVFVKNNNTSEYKGCDQRTVSITPDQKLNVDVGVYQNNSLENNLFQMGSISISVNTSTSTDSSKIQWKDDGPSQEGSGGGTTLPSSDNYHYELFFDRNNESEVYKRNDSTLEISHNFTKEGNNTVIVEVIYNKTFNGSSTLYYGEQHVRFEVYEPIKETAMKFVNKSGTNVSVAVTASGSVPIFVSWVIDNSTNNSTALCSNKGQVVLNDTTKIGTFNCTMNKPGTYLFYANFSNKVSNKTDKYSYTIKKPSNTKTVVTTSTTVVIVVLLIIVVVVAIVFVSGYISYQKLKNRSTETANFTFIDLQKPSKLQRVKSQLASVKDKVSKGRPKRLGLVQAKDGELSDVESFYGSLTHFSDHDNL